ncbi:MAG: hypothetical protein KF889_25600 [Alphaproteobacteria bacterium]|nr:hypothetical protein [Alphaproteobacteria bacterium]MCW5739629.1 hypothetical protein [Alphaproteobacteria bacterium]
MLTDDRLRAIVADGERVAQESRFESDQRYYADVAAALRMVLAVRELCTAWEQIASSNTAATDYLLGMRHQMKDCALQARAIVGGAGGEA